MTDHELGRDVEIFCSRHGVPLPLHIEPIRSGRNSQVSKLSHGDGKWILKKYYQPVGTQRDRLGTEFSFLAFLNGAGVVGIPQPLGMDRVMHCGLYSFLPGNHPDAIAATHISQAASFIRTINRFRELSVALALPLAADACLSWQDHLELTEIRVSRLMVMKPESAVEVDEYAFVTKQLLPLWLSVKAELFLEIPPMDLTQPLPSAERILSPSDFGFHNTLEHQGCLSFVDFEYAGWDDPAKLICDFLCQPELPVTATQGWQFTYELLENWPCADSVIKRVDKLLPVHRLKWCCILLNEFRVEDRERRLHAGIDSEGLLAAQLSKAKSYFKVHLAPLT
jgi:hypothetical protein